MASEGNDGIELRLLGIEPGKMPLRANDTIYYDWKVTEEQADEANALLREHGIVALPEGTRALAPEGTESWTDPAFAVRWVRNKARHTIELRCGDEASPWKQALRPSVGSDQAPEGSVLHLPGTRLALVTASSNWGMEGYMTERLEAVLLDLDTCAQGLSAAHPRPA